MMGRRMVGGPDSLQQQLTGLCGESNRRGELMVPLQPL